MPARRSRRDEWTAVAAALAQGGKSDADQARRFGLLASLPLSDRVETYLDIFCTASDRTPRKSIVSKAIKDAELGRAAQPRNRPAFARCWIACAP